MMVGCRLFILLFYSYVKFSWNVLRPMFWITIFLNLFFNWRRRGFLLCCFLPNVSYTYGWFIWIFGTGPFYLYNSGMPNSSITWKANLREPSFLRQPLLKAHLTHCTHLAIIDGSFSQTPSCLSEILLEH